MTDSRNGKRVTLKATPTPLTRMAGCHFDVRPAGRTLWLGGKKRLGCRQIFAKCKLLLTLDKMKTQVK